MRTKNKGFVTRREKKEKKKIRNFAESSRANFRVSM